MNERGVRELSNTKVRAFQKKILTWYRKNGRHDLLWRKQPTPYRVLVSEIMLQQTQVSRVTPKYQAWLKEFSTLKALAEASGTEVLRAWSGLGYNRRALLLRKAAREIIEHYKGKFPTDVETLQTLPGIGPYTAGAINVFARNVNDVCIDTNIRRVLISELKLSPKISAREVYKVALRVLPHDHSRDWHNALMDYGALIATSRRTGLSPLTKQSRFQGSDRQARGAIVRYLSTVKSASEASLCRHCHLDRLRTKRALKSLLHDQLVLKLGRRYLLVS